MDNKKAFVVNLKFGAWRNQVWFSGDNTPESETKWDTAINMLEDIGKECTTSNIFFQKAVALFESCGFARIEK